MSALFASLLVFLLLATASAASAGQVPAPAAPLVLQAAPGLILAQTDARTNTYRYDSGPVDSARTAAFERIFTLKNESKQPVMITRLRGSCGCESLVLQKDGKSLTATRLGPGQQVLLHLTIAVYPGQAGPARKYIWVDGPQQAGQGTLLAVLEVDLTIWQSAFFQPRALDFGKVDAGAGAIQPLTVSVDDALYAGAVLPPLLSSDPEVRVTAVGSVQQVEAQGRTWRRQSYRVQLSPSAHSGQVSSDLRFAAVPFSGGTAFPQTGVSATVTGTVRGALEAMPSTVFFGSLPAGRPVSRSVVLFLSAPTPARAIHVSTSVPWLHAALDASNPSAQHCLLTVTLSAQAPAGSLQGKVMVTLPSGECLNISVVAEMVR